MSKTEEKKQPVNRQQRHNINTIAEILIDKINDLNKDARRIEKIVDDLKSSSMSVDTSGFEKLISERRQQEKSFLDDSKAVLAKNRTRLPNWITAGLIIALLALVGFSFYAFDQLKEVELMKLKIEHYESQ